MDERELRNLKADIKDLRERMVPVSDDRVNKLWKSVRDTLDEFSEKLVEAELGRRGHSDTLAKILAQQKQMDVVLAAHAVQLSEMQEQVNTLAVALDEALEDLHGGDD